MEFLIIYVSIIIGMFIVTIKDFDNVAVTPKEIYECNNFNIFACVIVFIIMFLVNPLFFVAHFLYWLFHVEKN
mgnify:CR=1 FL=1